MRPMPRPRPTPYGNTLPHCATRSACLLKAGREDWPVLGCDECRSFTVITPAMHAMDVAALVGLATYLERMPEWTDEDEAQAQAEQQAQREAMRLKRNSSC